VIVTVGVAVLVGVSEGVWVGRRVRVGPGWVGAGVSLGGKVGVTVVVPVALGVEVGAVGLVVGDGVNVQAGGSVGKARAVRSVPGTTRVTSTGRAVGGMEVAWPSKLYCIARTAMTPMTSTISRSTSIVMSRLDELEEAFTWLSLSDRRRAPLNYTQLL
jgi:hypothetical protein